MEQNNNSTNSENSKFNTNHRWIYLIIGGIIATIISPFLFTISAHWDRLDFTQYGPVGDTIGGITAPIIGLLGAILVYLSFTEQRKANKLQWEALMNERSENLTNKKLELISKYFETEIKNRKDSSGNSLISNDFQKFWNIIMDISRQGEGEGLIKILKTYIQNDLNAFHSYISLFHFCIDELIKLNIDNNLKRYLAILMVEEYNLQLKKYEPIFTLDINDENLKLLVGNGFAIFFQYYMEMHQKMIKFYSKFLKIKELTIL